MSVVRGFSAGIVAAVVLSVALAFCRSFGLHLDFAQILGTVAASRPTVTNWFVGYCVFLFLSGLVGVLYAGAFQLVGQAGPAAGAALGLGHACLAGLFLGFMSWAHPLIRSGRLPSPGFFDVAEGLPGVVGLVALFVLFGWVTGLVYLHLFVSDATPA